MTPLLRRLLFLIVLLLALINVSKGFQVVGQVFSQLREQHNAFTRSMLSSSPAFGRQPSSPSSSHSPSSGLFPCTTTSYYSYFSTRRKASNVNGDGGAGDEEKSVVLARKLVRQMMVALWKALAFPYRALVQLKDKLRKGDKDIKPASAKEMSEMQINGSPKVAEPAEVPKPAVLEPTVETTKEVAVIEPVVEKEKPVTAPAPAPAKAKTKKRSSAMPQGERWAVSAPRVDLSGDWQLMVTEDFKKQYDEYLTQLGQPSLVRSVALGIVGFTTELTKQSDDGRTLFIRGTNARGVWERSLISSGADRESEEFKPQTATIITADDEKVDSEAWWEDEGRIHRSWLRGVTKYGGGDFESRRYLEDNGKVLICQSTFHPSDESRPKASVSWRFLRKGETLKA